MGRWLERIEEVLYGGRKKRKSIRQLDVRYQKALKGQSLGVEVGVERESGTRRRKAWEDLESGVREAAPAANFFPRTGTTRKLNNT